MRTLRILAVSCSLIVVCSPAQVGAAGSYGSLAVFVPTRDGLAVCADRREWNSVAGARDSFIKIRSVGSRLAYVATGSVAILDAATLRPEFSVYEEIQKYLSTNGSQPTDRIENLPRALEESYRRYRNGGGSKLLPSPDASDDVIFSVMVWWATGQHVQAYQIQLHQGTVEGASHMSHRDMTMELAQKLYIEGQTTFLLAAISKSDPRFRFFKDDPEIRTVWTSASADSISPDAAVRFGRKVIAATNKYHSQVSRAPVLVSASADCSLMSPGRGFEWITR